MKVQKFYDNTLVIHEEVKSECYSELYSFYTTEEMAKNNLFISHYQIEQQHRIAVHFIQDYDMKVASYLVYIGPNLNDFELLNQIVSLVQTYDLLVGELSNFLTSLMNDYVHYQASFANYEKSKALKDAFLAY